MLSDNGIQSRRAGERVFLSHIAKSAHDSIQAGGEIKNDTDVSNNDNSIQAGGEIKHFLSSVKESQTFDPGGRGNKEELLSNNDKSSEPHNTQKKVADSLGWSTGKTAQAQYVWDHAGGEIKNSI